MRLIIISIISFVASFLITYFSTPYIRNASSKRGLLDLPDSRKVHTKPIVRLGGISIYLGFLISNLLTYSLTFYQDNIQLRGNSIIILVGTTLFFAIGLIEDLKNNIDPFKRLILQFIATTIIWIYGFKISSISLNLFNAGFDQIIFSDFVSILLTSIFIVGTVNSINWIDGIDGLACGISLISLVSILFLINPIFYPIILSLIGSSLAFMKFNFKPASIIMGDSGSYLLGFSLSSLSILASSDPNSISFTGNVNPYVVFLLLLIPLFDMTRVIFMRISKGLSPFYPDKSHLHHLLADFGFNYGKIILCLYSISVISCLFAIALK